MCFFCFYKFHFISVVDSIRLIGGSTPLIGRVEVFARNEWGTICDDGWDINDANVVCRQLGFPQASQAYRGANHGQGTGRIWLDDLTCSRGESYISDCGNRSGWESHDCSHRQDASVACSSSIH